VDCIADQIKQVFLNISMNAIEAMHSEGGQLSVDMDTETLPGMTGVVFREQVPVFHLRTYTTCLSLSSPTSRVALG
jgi:phosphoglycerate-specific signal transduction histidine kinase